MTIILADEHPFLLEGIKHYLQHRGHEVIGICDNGLVALNLIKINVPDIAILDIDLEGMSGLDILQHIREQKIKTQVVIMTKNRDRSVYMKSMAYNILGYILKEYAVEELGKCLQMKMLGQKYINEKLQNDLVTIDLHSAEELEALSATEKHILKLIAQQKTSKQIAEALFVSEKTIEGHRSRIIEKLNIPKEKNALLIWAIQMRHILDI